uniref:DUF38 domain-containing protein n=1 Tax=Panagrolaimus sp. ES5 TaxID=591445 RepID=A0AC34GP80_9BILA
MDALMKDLDVQTESFMETITQTTVKDGIRRKPISDVVYKKFERFISSIDNVISFYERQNGQHEAVLYPPLKTVNTLRIPEKAPSKQVTFDFATVENDEMNQRIAELEAENATFKAQITQKNDLITQLNDRASEQEALVYNMETEVYEMQNTITRFSKLIDPSPSTSTNGVVAHGKRKYDYVNLSGKVRVVDWLEYKHYNNKWFADGREIFLNSSDFQICIKQSLVIANNIPSTLISRLQCNNLHRLIFRNAVITNSEYKKLVESPNLNYLQLCSVTVEDENGKILEVDQLLKGVPNVENFTYEFDKRLLSRETVKNLAKLPPFPKLRYVSLRNIPDGFNLKVFGEFINKNPSASYFLQFHCSTTFYEEIKIVKQHLAVPSTCNLNITL